MAGVTKRRIRVVVEYDGTGYAGWQRQKEHVSVQQVIEEALERICGHPVVIHSSGRTDSGVHALGMAFHFDTTCRIRADKFCYALNAYLPRDIRAHASHRMANDFHARYHAQGKHYRYQMHNAPHASALQRNFRLHIHQELDLTPMQKAAAALTGTHDFAAFRSTGSSIQGTVRTITRSSVTREGELVYYDVCGSGFLYNMVRIIVGTLVDIGLHRMDADCIERALATGERALLGATAPAHGLMLVEVFYPRGLVVQETEGT